LTESLAEGTTWSFENCPFVEDELLPGSEARARLRLVEDLALRLMEWDILKWEDGLDAMWDRDNGRWSTTVQWAPRYGPDLPDGTRGGV
jgi:hypothetical protein